MANADNPRGLTPYMSGSNAGTPRIREYYASVTTAIFKGDVVVGKSTGRIHSLRTASGAILTRGVAAQYHAAGTTPVERIAVYDDPKTLFLVNSDGTTDPTKATAIDHIGGTADLVVSTGSTGSGQSAFELDYSLIGTTTTDPVYIVDISKQAGNDPALMHGDYVVKLTRHVESAQALTAI